MNTNEFALHAAARERAFSFPIEQVDPSLPELFGNGTAKYYFERLRRDDPVHWTHSPIFGNFWSVTKYQDVMTVDINHKVFSSDMKNGGCIIADSSDPAQQRVSFINMDPPEHDVRRNAVSPIVAPSNLNNMESLIRERTQSVLDSLPRNETFDWVEKVSIELTTRMLATLFDFPFEDRKLLTWWSDVWTSMPDQGASSVVPTQEARQIELSKMTDYFTRLWNERVNAPPGNDLISMLAHNPSTRHITPEEFRATIALLIVGGNDTTRNSMSGGLLALHDNPDQAAKLRANHALVESLVPEIVRWQTPVSHFRRTAMEDFELGGKRIKAGDKVVMWYASANRDESAIENANQFIIDRARPRQHLSFGFGIHRCVGNRLAELQLRILWEEMLKRDLIVRVVAPAKRLAHPMVHGITELMVRIDN